MTGCPSDGQQGLKVFQVDRESEPERWQKWAKAVKTAMRSRNAYWKSAREIYVCGGHFIDGKCSLAQFKVGNLS